MNILITGGLGFIGSALARQLLSKGHEVRLLDNLAPQIHGELPKAVAPEGAKVFRLSIREVLDRIDVVEGADVVFHLAAETGTAQSMYRIAHYVDVNELGTAALLEAIAKCSRRPKHLVLASSRSVYGEGAYRSASGELVQPSPRTREQMLRGSWDHTSSDGAPLTPIATPESLPPMPGSVYAATKVAQEALVAAAAPALGLRSTIFRFQNVYGEGQSLRNPYTGIISIFFNRARQGLEIPVYEDGNESRDFVHVDDVVSALCRCLDVELASGTILNVGSGVSTSVAELARTLVRLVGKDVAVRTTGQFRVGDIRHCWADQTRFRSLLGLVPSISLEDGLARFCKWAETQPVHEDRLEQATQELRQRGLTNA